MTFEGEKSNSEKDTLILIKMIYFRAKNNNINNVQHNIVFFKIDNENLLKYVRVNKGSQIYIDLFILYV